MRAVALGCWLVLLSHAAALAQNDVTPAEVEPPLEIVVPEPSEELPLPPAATPTETVLPLAPRGAQVGQLRAGMFVTSAELYPRVRIEDADDMHPQAVPAIIAVMDPHRDRRVRLAQHTAPINGLVFVKIFVPPYPPRSVKVKHEEIELDWGEYEIKIEAEDGVVEIEYED